MIILAVDYGDVRTGLAVCDRLEMMASPAGVIIQKNAKRLAVEVVNAAKERNAEMIVVGLPKNMDGSSGFRANASMEFAELIKRLTDIPVLMRDERLTTAAANTLLNQTGNRGIKRKEIIDTVAAVMILQDFIDFRKRYPDAN